MKGFFYNRISQAVFIFYFLFSISIPVNAKTADDEYFSQQWYLDSINASEAWDTSTGSKQVVVAVLDTGIDIDHPDLARNIWVNDDEIGNDGIDNDNNGYVDDVNGYDFVDDDPSVFPNNIGSYDINAVTHGTVISGIIGAVGNNGEGIAGINWKVKLMSVRILDNLGVGDSNLATLGVEYAVENGADVINLSFTGFDYDNRLADALKLAYDNGVVVVAAIGNSEDGGIDTDITPIYPACYGESTQQDWILGVGATNQNDEKTTFSNYGSTCVDISAPGENIFSTVYQDDDWDEFIDGFYQDGWSGTSMAVPMVVGASALLRGAYSSLTPDDIKKILRLSADPIVSEGGAVGKVGAGRLNIESAMELARSFAQNDNTLSVAVSVGKPSYRIAVAPEKGDPPIVRVFTNSGSEVVSSFDAYDFAFTGGVRLTMGDVDGDGYEEIITVPGSGGGPQVRVFDLKGKLMSQFNAFENDYRFGLFVATGDINNDGVEEIAVSTDEGGGAQIRIFDRTGVQKGDAIFPYGETASDDSARDELVSVRVALGDVDGDDKDEIITSFGEGSEPRVQVYKPNGELVSEFLAYASAYDRGVFVASGDLDNDGDDEIVTGTDNGGGPQVQIFDGEGGWLGTFFAYDKNFRGGVRLSVGNLSDSKGASIITAAGPGGGPHIRVYNGYAKLIGTFFSSDADDRFGINSGTWGM